MSVRVEPGVGNQKLLILDESIIMDPLEVATITIRCAEPTVIDNTKNPKILVPASANHVVTLCPTIIHPTRVMETVIANPTSTMVTLMKGQVIGILVPANDINIENVAKKDNIVSDINVIHAYMTEIVDYPDESAAPSVLTSPIYLPPEGISNTNYTYSHNLMASPGPSTSINMVQANFEGFDINPNLSADKQQQLFDVIKEYNDVFFNSLKEINTLNCSPYVIRLKDNVKPLKSRPYAIPHDAQEWLKGTLDELIHTGKIDRSTVDNEWASPAILIPSDIDKRHKKRKRPVRGPAPDYQIMTKSTIMTKVPRKGVWGNKIYNISTGDVVNGVSKQVEEEYLYSDSESDDEENFLIKELHYG